jgi:SAM-dependent methyltransferase
VTGSGDADHPSPIAAPDTLAARYTRADLTAFTPAERRRFLPLGDDTPLARVAWELLYRREPELYDRLIAGERLHPGLLDVLPAFSDTAVEVGAGTGRLTVELAARACRLVAVEPAAALREILARRLPARVRIVPGFFDELPLRDGCADLVAACSAFTAEAGHGGEAGLRELERVCAPGGMVAILWPREPEWLIDRGYAHETFAGEMAVDFGTLEEALEISRIFYPHATDEITQRAEPSVPYEVLGMNPPADLCWKRIDR